MVSCRSSDQWRRAKLNVGSREPFDDLHRCTALGAAIQGAGVVCGRGGGVVCRAQQLKAKRQSRGAPTAGQEAVMPDAHEALRQDVQQEAAQELVDRQGSELLLIMVCRIAPAKSNLAILERD